MKADDPNRTDDDIFELDPHKLDEEWLDQPKIYFRYAEKLANARARYDGIKNNLEILEANLDKKMRANPEDFGITKITEDSLKRAILAHPKRVKVSESLLEAKHEMDVLSAFVGALDHRKKALENLVQLFIANYFSSPRASGEAGRAMKEKEANAAFRTKGRRDA